MKGRKCKGEYNAWDAFCVNSCGQSIECLKLKLRVLQSCLPSPNHLERIAKRLRIETDDDALDRTDAQSEGRARGETGTDVEEQHCVEADES